VTAWLLALVACHGDEPRAAFRTPGERGTPIVVEVLNASWKPGLARVAVRMLRREGVDVVGYGTAPAAPAPLDSTRILVRRGDIAAGERVRRVLGVGKVVVQRDSTLLLDASVLLGRDFAPRLDFHP
jgi:hypothetical protein